MYDQVNHRANSDKTPVHLPEQELERPIHSEQASYYLSPQNLPFVAPSNEFSFIPVDYTRSFDPRDIYATMPYTSNSTTQPLAYPVTAPSVPNLVPSGQTLGPILFEGSLNLDHANPPRPLQLDIFPEDKLCKDGLWKCRADIHIQLQLRLSDGVNPVTKYPLIKIMPAGYSRGQDLCQSLSGFFNRSNILTVTYSVGSRYSQASRLGLWYHHWQGRSSLLTLCRKRGE